MPLLSPKSGEARDKFVVLVSSEDECLLEKRRWFRHSAGYVVANNGRGQVMYLHRIVLARMLGRYLIGQEQPDHVNGVRHDCRRENLRLADFSKQQMNRKKSEGMSSRFKGVTWHTKGRKWMAQIGGTGSRGYLGLFCCEEDAAVAYDKAAALCFGEFAKLNFSKQGHATS